MIEERHAMQSLRLMRMLYDRGWPAAVLLVVGGCQHCGWWGDHCAEIPPGAVPAPVGTYNTQWQQSQESRADDDFLVFYQYEWLGDSDQFSPAGQRHLDRLLQRLPHSAAPIVIETSGDDERDRLRIAAMQLKLAQHDSDWAAYPVVAGRSQAEPLYGFEAPRVTSGFIGRGGGGAGGGQVGGQGGGGQGGGGFGGGGGGGGGGFGGGGVF